MTRWIGYAALAALLAVGLTVRADKDDEKKDEKKSDKGSDAKAAKAFAELQAEFDKELKDAGKDEAKRKAVFDKYSPKFLAHAKSNPRDDTATLALEFVIQLHSPKDKVKSREEAIALLKKEYVKTKQIRPILRTLVIVSGGVGGDPACLEIVKAVAKDNPDKLTRATALDVMADGLEFRSLVAAALARNEKRQAEYAKLYGEDFVNKFIDSAEDSKKEADTLRKTLDADYADVMPKKDDGAKEGDVKLTFGGRGPEVELQDVDGKAVKLSDLKGKVVVLDFWATWCGPCRAMIPHTRKLVKQHEKKPFVFVSVSCDEKRETLKDFTTRTEMPWTHWWDGRGGNAARAYEVRAFPTIYAIDHKGNIRFKSVGFDSDLDSVVEKLIKEAEGEKKK